MTLITKGMGAIRKALKSAKKEFVSPKTNIPLYTAGAAVLGGKIAYEKVKTKIKGLKKGKK
jgi:hypothetical protein